MLKNYFKTTIRNILRRKLNTLVVMCGLVISFTFCLLMFLYVNGALGWDDEHPQGERLYLLAMDYYQEDDVPESFGLFDFSEKPIYRNGTLPYKHLRDYQENLPEFSESVIVYNLGNRGKSDVRIGNEVFQKTITSADPGFLDFFAYELLAGNPAEAEANLRSVVISEKVAEQFSGGNALGEVIQVLFEEELQEFVVGAVVRLPQKSSVRFDILMNLEANKSIRSNLYNLESNAAFSFFTRLPENQNIGQLENKLQGYFEQTYSAYIAKERRFAEIREDSPLMAYRLINAGDIHLDTLLSWEGKVNAGHIMVVGIFSLVLLVVSGINYLLITMATLSSRVGEISLRRISGARKVHVLLQFWLESSLVILLSLLVSVCVLQYSLPYIIEQTGVELHVPLAQLLKSAAFMALILLGLSLIISLYPSQVISRFRLSETLKGNDTYKISTRLINWLVSVQFALCFIFIASGLIMNQQLNFIMEKDLGFDQEQIVYVPVGDSKFKQALLTHSEFEAVGRGGGWLFGHGRMGFINKLDGENVNLMQLEAEKDLLNLFGLKIDWLEPELGEGRLAIVNGATADLIGRNLLTETKIGFEQRIVGVIENTYLSPFTEEDAYFFINPKSQERSLFQTFVKIRAGELTAGLDKLEAVWNELYPDKFLNFQFLDEYIEENYQSHRVTANLLNLITVLGIAIACLGLFALNGIITQNRLKEIGIRKVLGAGVRQLIVLINQKIFLALLVAGLLAMPVAYEITHRWMENFTLQLPVTWHYFALAMTIGVVMSLLVVSTQTLKSIYTNPVDLIRDE